MDIQPASIDQVQSGRDGHVRVVTADVGNVAAELRALDRSLVLRFHEHGDYYSVAQVLPDGSEHLVTTCQPVAGGVDPRLVGRLAKVIRPDYDVTGEIEQVNDRVRHDRVAAAEERVDEAAEVAAFHLRRAAGATSRVFVP